MNKILLCCAAGMSTSMVVQRMEKAAKEKTSRSTLTRWVLTNLTSRLAGATAVCLATDQI